MAIIYFILIDKICVINKVIFVSAMVAEISNWAVIAAAMDTQGETKSEMVRRAKALAQELSDPMPTSDPAAPFSIFTISSYEPSLVDSSASPNQIR